MAFTGTYHVWDRDFGIALPLGTFTVEDEDTTLSGGETFTANDLTFTYAGRVNGSTTDFVATFGSTPFVFSPDAGAYDGAPFPGYSAGTAVTLVCFVAGTRILTERGEVAVEALRPGDLVATLADPAAPFAPVLWIGLRHLRLAGIGGARAMAPIRIRAGALAEATPHRDLLVSPDHALLLEGRLVPARLLVNGRTILEERGLAEVTYCHIELARHDAVLAEGAAAESWLDAGNRSWFQNSPDPLPRVAATLAEHATRPMAPCAPVLQAGPELGALRDRLALRAEALPAAVAA